MIPSNLNQSSLPLKKRSQDLSHHLPTSTPTTNTSYPLPVSLDNIEDQGANCGEIHGHHYLQQQREERSHEFLLIDGSSDFQPSFSTNNHDYNDKMDHGYHNEDEPGSVKWIPSKMRWMRKMMGSEQTVMSKPRRSMENLQEGKQQNKDSSRNFPTGPIRVCSDCSTTKTPLWRSGPQGPKSLCNACGIRQRKARRALAAAAAGGGLLATNTPREVQKEKRTERDGTIPNKKRCKITTTRTAQKKFQVDDIMISLSDDSAFHRVFPQDEKDAAILLMALSCGLIHGWALLSSFLFLFLFLIFILFAISISLAYSTVSIEHALVRWGRVRRVIWDTFEQGSYFCCFTKSKQSGNVVPVYIRLFLLELIS